MPGSAPCGSKDVASLTVKPTQQWPCQGYLAANTSLLSRKTRFTDANHTSLTPNKVTSPTQSLQLLCRLIKEKLKNCLISKVPFKHLGTMSSPTCTEANIKKGNKSTPMHSAAHSVHPEARGGSPASRPTWPFNFNFSYFQLFSSSFTSRGPKICRSFL